MKATIRSAKMDKDGRHNDRNFDVSTASHIDRELMGYNKYYTYNGDMESSFLDIEKRFYEEHFSDYVNEQNERNTIAGHKNRNRTIDDYYTNKKTRPEDVILQIGDMYEHATGDELWDCALEYKNKFEELCGDKCKILDMALHLDEATPHVHIRRVWIAEDERGNECVNQTKCLRELDTMIPDASRAEDRYNNQKISFTKMEREIFLQVCESEGFEIERTPENRRHLSTKEFKMSNPIEVDFTKTKNQIDELVNLYLQDLRIREKYRKQLEDIERKSYDEKAGILSEITEDFKENASHELSLQKNEIDEKYESAKLTSELQKLRDFLSEKGLLDEYENSFKRLSNERADNRKKDSSISIPTTSFF